jgi:transcriptional regulator with XRE-family HTH domain
VPVSVTVHPARLRRELARRALSATDLARLSGLSAATITAALAGRGISAKSLQLMAAALTKTPVVEVIDALLGQSRFDGLT